MKTEGPFLLVDVKETWTFSMYWTIFVPGVAYDVQERSTCEQDDHSKVLKGGPNEDDN